MCDMATRAPNLHDDVLAPTRSRRHQAEMPLVPNRRGRRSSLKHRANMLAFEIARESQCAKTSVLRIHMNAEDASLGALALAGDFEGQHVRAVLQRASPTATIWYEGHFRLVPTGPRWGEDIIM